MKGEPFVNAAGETELLTKYSGMAKVKHQLTEGFSFGGTFLYKVKADAEGIAAMLGLQGAFPVVTDEGQFWMPGSNYQELVRRINSDGVLPNQAPIPQAHPLLSFNDYIKTHEQ